MSLVCWSGGCDSTLILFDLCRESSEAHPVKALSISHPQVVGDEEHRKARQVILEGLRKRGHHITHQELHIRVHGSDGAITKDDGKDAWFHGDDGGGIVQPVIWMPLAATYLGKEEDLYMGYVREDDLWQYEGNFTRAFGDVQFLMGKKGIIKYPLKGEHKWEVLKRLKALKLLDLCWYCETPKNGAPCGRCASCFRHETSLWQLAKKEEKEKEDRKGKKNVKVPTVRGRRRHTKQRTPKRRR